MCNALEIVDVEFSFTKYFDGLDRRFFFFLNALRFIRKFIKYSLVRDAILIRTASVYFHRLFTPIGGNNTNEMNKMLRAILISV